MEELESLKNEINKCVKCGACRSICPTFRVIGRESASARGKITLIGARLGGELGLTDAYLKHIKECTMCGACRDVCPNGVDTTGIINAARAEAVKEQGLPFMANLLLKNILDSSKLMPFALKCAARFQGLGPLRGVFFKDSGTDNGLVSRFSLPVVGHGRLIPPLAQTFFLDMPEVKALAADSSNPALSLAPTLPSPMKGEEKRKGSSRGGETQGFAAARTGKDRAARPLKVAFYAGCGVNYLMPNVGVKSIEAVKKAGGAVVVPDSQVCCGMPAYYMGDVETARNLAMKNMEAFEGYDCDYIVTACATCTYGLKSVFRELLSGQSAEITARVNAFCSKVTDITVLLADVLKYRAEGWKKDAKRIVTYHDPCHLNRNLGVRDEPRELLKGNDSLVFKQMRFPCSCCGLGGGVSLANYELSIEITKRKAQSVRDSGADIVATACPGCIVQIRDGLHRYGVDAEVRHVVELL